MNKLPPKQKRPKGASRQDLLKLSKEELADRVIQLEAHNIQLKNVISKNLSKESERESGPYKNQKKFDFSNSHFRPVLLHILYFGWDYQGFVVQEDTIQTIEHHLFKALTKACFIQSRETAKYNRCGRTDKGVSALGQVVSLYLRSRHSPEKQTEPGAIASEMNYCKVLNRLLPKDIRAVAWMPVPEGFSARFDCKLRQYKYYFPRSNLRIDAMREACALLVGNHDFRNLCKMDVGNGVTEFRRAILKADIVAVNENDKDKPTSMFYLLMEGNAFLWHQIRCIQAVLLLIGDGYESPSVISRLLDSETNRRKPQYNLAIDLPLNLFKCTYEVGGASWRYDEEDLAKSIMHFQGEWTKHNIKATMLNDCLQSLQSTYTDILKEKGVEGPSCSGGEILAYHNCLTEGMKPKSHTPLMKRPTCSSLEERIEHYKRKRTKYLPEEPMAGDKNKK